MCTAENQIVWVYPATLERLSLLFCNLLQLFLLTQRKQNKGFLFNLNTQRMPTSKAAAFQDPFSKWNHARHQRVAVSLFFRGFTSQKRPHRIFSQPKTCPDHFSRHCCKCSCLESILQWCKERFCDPLLILPYRDSKGSEVDVGCPFLTDIGTQKQLGGVSLCASGSLGQQPWAGQ